MRVPSLALLCALTAPLTLPGQAPTVPEIRGAVFETGTTTPIAGAEVSLNEFAPNEENFVVNKTIATTVTDARGNFVFRPGHLGSMTVVVKREGYGASYQNGQFTGATNRGVELTPQNPVQEMRLSLARPAVVTGRVVDQDGKPVANLPVGIDLASRRFSSGIEAVTDADGRFSKNVSPGSYIAHVGAELARDDEDLLDFSEEAFKVVDEDVESAYWPGGLPDAEHVLPVPAGSGGIANIGTITVRKVPYYRLRIRLNGDCAANERWNLRLRTVGPDVEPVNDRYTACHKDALLTRVPRGSYELAVWNGRNMTRWAVAPFTVTKENTSVNLQFSSSIDVPGRITAADGGDLKKLGDVQVMLRPGKGFPSSVRPAEVKDGRFEIQALPWRTQWLSVLLHEPTTYVKQILYGGQPVRSHELDAAPGAGLEIVLESGAASLSVTTKNGDAVVEAQVILVAASITQVPVPLTSFPPFLLTSRDHPTDPGRVIQNVTPGEYRIVPLPRGTTIDFLDDAAAIGAVLATAQRITFAKGEHKSLELQVRQ